MNKYNQKTDSHYRLSVFQHIKLIYEKDSYIHLRMYILQ